MPKQVPDGPIPGENYTSDTRNYPWHRPPEIDDMDEAIAQSVVALTEKKRAYSLLTMLQSGVTVAQATDIFVTSGIGKGKWTPDFAILLAGPVAKAIQMMAESYGIDYDMGIDDDHIDTIEYVKEAAKLDPSRVADAAEETRENASDIVAEKGKHVPMSKGFSAGPNPMNEGTMASSFDAAVREEM